MIKFLFLVASLVFVLGGCGVPRTSTPPAEPPRQVEELPEVEAVVDVVEEDSNSGEFERVKRMLLERGILKEGIPVYRLGEIVEVGESRFTLERFFWGEGRMVVSLKFYGVEERRDEKGLRWRHMLRPIIDNREHYVSIVEWLDLGDDYVMYFDFTLGIPDPGSYEDYILVLVRIRETPEERQQFRDKIRFGMDRTFIHSGDGLKKIFMEEEIPFILTREEMIIRK